MIKKIKIVIICAGNIAEEHIKAFKAQDNCDLIGIYSRTKIKAIRIADKYKISNVVDLAKNFINKNKKPKIIYLLYILDLKLYFRMNRIVKMLHKVSSKLPESIYQATHIKLILMCLFTILLKNTLS